MELALILALGLAVYLLRQRLVALELVVAELDAERFERTEPAATSEVPLKAAPDPLVVNLARAPVGNVVAPPPPPPSEQEPSTSKPSLAEAKASTDEVEESVAHASVDDWRDRMSMPFDFEDLFGRLLPIWAGGVTLAVAGFFMIRYSIEAGLLTHTARVLLGFVFGFGLIGGAEAARRWQNRISDPRVAQALAGAGIVTFYASFYMAGSFYGLMAPLSAFIGLAGVTICALVLSYRFGVPSAVLGLVGGFATPLLAGGSEANVPLLTLYLALTAGGLMASARHRGWAWLGLSAIGGGLAWGLLLIVMGAGGAADIIALGLFAIAAGILLPAFLPRGLGGMRWIVEAVAAVVAAVEMAALVGQTGYSTLSWSMFVLLAAALAVLGWRKIALRRASAFAAVLVPALLTGWDAPVPASLAMFATIFALLLAGVPLIHVWLRRSNIFDQLQVVAASLGLFAVFVVHGPDFTGMTDQLLLIAGTLLAAFPALAAWRLWPTTDENMEPIVIGLSATVMALLLCGVCAVLPGWTHTIVAACLALCWMFLARGRKDAGIGLLAWTTSILAAMLLTIHSGTEFQRLAGLGQPHMNGLGAIRWAALAAVFAGLASWEYRRAGRMAEAAAAVFIYGALAQLVPAAPLGWIAALGAAATAFGAPRRVGAQLAFVAITALWALEPIAEWGMNVLAALVATPMLVTGVPDVSDIALHMWPLAFASVVVIVLRREWLGDRQPLAMLATGSIAIVAGHALFKHVFALADDVDFIRLGLIERTVWQSVLILLGWLVWRLRDKVAPARYIGAGLAGAGLAHWLYFSLFQLNPAWSAQAVGGLPIVNMLLPLYGLGMAAVIFAGREIELARGQRRIGLDIAAMLLITMFGFSELRQFFAGSLLGEGLVGEAEGLLRSLLGIVLAIGFLLWGARRGQRSWRIGSLVLIVLAVGKVFLVDAAGLEGIARIVSFVALGFSLIGIGWFYSRLLRSPAAEGEAA